ncbi:hypothetical protein M8542_07510 [Amycolatopsis sp. OK19-0408]|uniref:Uncharacterized protein n=1 Tax=Amycolatopsis iheyensis TaxID=2945988 RepID=A0A9X2N8S1_9PSEU|nr:hypothetical protein [Amycolatopsis iheyensis]MCR6482661.1 hypothetical protein [Amycolatopsis iheyensis]
MARLGYRRFGAQGSDWGTSIATSIGQRQPDRVDSPAALCAWIVEKFWSWTDSGGDLHRVITCSTT